MYHLLTENFNEEQSQLLQIILEAVPAQQVYLLGSTLLQRRTETVFMPEAPSCRRAGHYYLLVLVKEEVNCAEMQDKLENTCRRLIPVTILVMNSDSFIAWLLAGHAFAHTVQQRAVLLHGEAIVDPNLQAIEAPVPYAAKQKWQDQEKVKAFFAGAELFIIRKEYKMAAFMLHQCAEQALLTLFKKGSGLHVNTHNLDKLVRYCTMVNYTISDILPRNNEQQERLFQLLQRAYIDTRYKNDYNITLADLEAIKAMLAKLLEIMC